MYSLFLSTLCSVFKFCLVFWGFCCLFVWFGFLGWVLVFWLFSSCCLWGGGGAGVCYVCLLVVFIFVQ